MTHGKLFLLAISFALGARGDVRLKELAALEGVRDNQLIGYGLVVGLNGTGDKRQTFFSAQSLTNLLERMGVTVPPQAILVRNMAAVMVTANLPAYAQPGRRIDVTVGAIGDAQNLQGGLLVLTPLRAADGQIYAVAQGPVVTGGFAVNAGAGNAQAVNHPTTGRVPEGAIVERAPPSIPPAARIRLQLRQADFTTAARIAEAVNQRFAPNAPPIAVAENSAAVVVDAPPGYANRPVEFIADLETLRVKADRALKVIVNERTGTVVMGKDIRIAPAAIMHGALSVEIQTQFQVSQPNPLAEGRTTVTPDVSVRSREEKARNILLKDGTTVEELVRALQAIGSTPRDIIAILQALRTAGALEAEIEVI
ncbi:MAG: flagellar basal body P-ring protein FlgI [Bryobacteraceae bacterium]|nr:flagellar basal body P-ring protein FlgI [Bryobacteraceae bacterium]